MCVWLALHIISRIKRDVQVDSFVIFFVSCVKLRGCEKKCSFWGREKGFVR